MNKHLPHTKKIQNPSSRIKKVRVRVAWPSLIRAAPFFDKVYVPLFLFFNWGMVNLVNIYPLKIFNKVLVSEQQIISHVRASGSSGIIRDNFTTS